MVLAAAVNTVVVKLQFLKRFVKPIDGGLLLTDQRRLFGGNKTWLGLFGLIIFGALFYVIWGIICSQNGFLQSHNYFYRLFQNTPVFSAICGALMGLAYALAELPNSFFKRRSGYKSGETRGGINGMAHIFIDHTDSILGCGLLMIILCQLTWFEFIASVIIGSLTHLAFNILLVFMGVKKNI